jgi:hypothetical protein
MVDDAEPGARRCPVGEPEQRFLRQYDELFCGGAARSAGSTAHGAVERHEVSIVSAPTGRSRPHALEGVSCVSTNVCCRRDGPKPGSRRWSSVGTAGRSSPNPAVPLRRWDCPPSPVRARRAVSPSDSWCSTLAAARHGTLTEQWDGTSWSIVSSPDPRTRPDDLQGVSCASTASCVAVAGTSRWHARRRRRSRSDGAARGRSRRTRPERHAASCWRTSAR